MLQAVRRLNGQCFSFMADAARNERARAEIPAVFAAHGLWGQVDPKACDRAGHCPILLLDLNFQRLDWWRQAISGEADETHSVNADHWFSVEMAIPLLRELMTEAWIAARYMPLAANLLFGMTPEVRAVIATFSVADVDRIVSVHVRSLRPRWDNSRTFWKHLLEGAVGADDRILGATWLHCLQLLGRNAAERYNESFARP